jgi:hypothetical protein
MDLKLAETSIQDEEGLDQPWGGGQRRNADLESKKVRDSFGRIFWVG